MRTPNARLILLLLLQVAALSLAAAPLVPYRAWQFHKLDVPYVSSTMKLARDYDVNTVVFSDRMIASASQLHDGSDRGAKLRQLAKEAHAQKLRVWIWVRELSNVPEQFLEDKAVQLDQPGLWEWLAQRYEKVFNDYPEFDGLILTFHETQYKVFDTRQVKSSLSMPDRFAAMINTIERVCARHKKDFIVRSFLYEPEQMAWFKEGYAKTGARVIVQTKCEPHDWDPFYPHNSLIGAFPGRKQIVEFDGSSEYTGKNRIPYTQPEYFEHRWRYDLSKPGVAGYNLRLDHGGYDSLRTPNEINVYAMYRFTQDPKVTGQDVWKEWTEKRYGKAAGEIEKALRPSFDIVNKSYFALKFWITAHSLLPDFNYADGHLASHTLAKWWPDKPEYKALEERLKKPDPALIEAVLSEKDEAIALAGRSLQHLENARPALTGQQYGDLYWRLALQHRVAIVWKMQAEAFFGLKVLQSGQQVPGLRERVERAIQALYMQAEVSAANSKLGDLPPASAKEIHRVADDLKERLRQIPLAAIHPLAVSSDQERRR